MARKHIAQTTAEEKAFLHGFIRANADKLRGAAHFYDRAADRTFTLAEAVACTKGGLVVEINDNRGDVRALVRQANGTCVVVSLTEWVIITVYYNAPDDTHATLNWAAYQWKVNLVEVVKGLRRANAGCAA